MSDQIQKKVAYSPAEFAALFGKSQTWGYRQLYAGKVKAMTGYGRVMIPASEVERLLSEAGRYLGKNRPVEALSKKASLKKEVKKVGRPNPWRKSLKQRKIGSGISKTPIKKKKESARLRAHRSSALRKLCARRPKSSNNLEDISD